MKLNRHLLRCHPGRKDQRPVHNRVVAEEEEVATTPHTEGEEVTTMGAIAMVVMTEEEEEAMIHHTEDEEVMIEEVTIKEAMIEEGEEDVVVMIMVAEEVAEETNSKEGGQMAEVVATRMATTGMATTEMQVFRRVATMVVGVAATKEEAMVAISRLHTQAVATKGVVATSRTTDTKMVGPTVTEGVGVEEGGVAVAVVVAVEVREEAGEAEVDRILIKVGNLSNTSSTEAISIISLVLDKEGILRAEAAKNFCFSRAQIIETWFQSPGL
ncbi:UNVERIFIED_CONTAM: hypothetical protein H355_003575 [Colinus virginianus]|nr:hypothetical protein H355_003575 [Colinus virginianus]